MMIAKSRRHHFSADVCSNVQNKRCVIDRKGLPMIKQCVIWTVIAASVWAQEPADRVLQDYHRAIQSEVFSDYPNLSPEQIHRKMVDLGNACLLAHIEELHPRAVQRYMSLPELAGIKLEKLVRLGWCERKELLDGDVLRPELAKTPLDQVLVFFSPESLGTALQHRANPAAWWDPVTAARDMQKMLFLRMLDEDDLGEREHIGRYAPNLMYRMNSDAEHPVVAFFDGRELLALQLCCHVTGQYTLQSIKWVMM
jgi:hypothetical protein